MENNLFEKRNALTTELRNTIDKWEVESKNHANNFDADANGIYKERCAKIEADLDAVEAQIQREATRSKLDKADNTPLFDTRGKSVGTLGDRKEDWGRRFIKALANGDNAELRSLQSTNFDGSEVRAMTVGTFNNDVAAIPVNFDEVIRQKLYMENVVRRISKVTRIDGQKRITIEAALPTTELVLESTAMSSPSDPTFGSLIDVMPYKFQTKVVLSNEFLEDALSGNGGVGGILDYVASKVATSMGRAHENYFCNGTNSSQPQGMGTSQFVAAVAAVNAGNVTRLAATGTALTAIDGDDIVDCYFGLQPQYRANGSWVMSDNVLKTVRKLKTTSTANEYLYKLSDTGDLREGVLGVLMGRPVYISPFYNTTAGANKPFVTFADFNFFEIFDRSGMNVLVDPYTAAATATTNMYAYSRLDSKATQLEAFSLIADAAT
jgi:HK97 family phage major capsid protein